MVCNLSRMLRWIKFVMKAVIKKYLNPEKDVFLDIHKQV